MVMVGISGSAARAASQGRVAGSCWEPRTIIGCVGFDVDVLCRARAWRRSSPINSPSSQVGVPNSEPSRPLRGLPVLSEPPRSSKKQRRPNHPNSGMPPLRGEDFLPGQTRTTEQRPAAAATPAETVQPLLLFPAGMPAPAHCAAKRNPEGEHCLVGLDRLDWAGARASSVPAMKLLNVNASSFTALSLKRC